MLSSLRVSSAIHPDQVAVQSADVESVCKTRKIIHTKVRSSLNTQTVDQLLYTYTYVTSASATTARRYSATSSYGASRGSTKMMTTTMTTSPKSCLCAPTPTEPPIRSGEIRRGLV